MIAAGYTGGYEIKYPAERKECHYWLKQSVILSLGHGRLPSSKQDEQERDGEMAGQLVPLPV